MGRVYLKKDEAMAVIEAIHNVEDTCGPLSPLYLRTLEKIRQYGLVNKSHGHYRSDEQKLLSLHDLDLTF